MAVAAVESLTEMIRSNVDKNELYSENYPFNLSLRISGFESEKEYTSFIKSCMKLVRASNEYNLWKKYIVDVLQIQNCAITLESKEECGIHIHHHMPSMFLINKALINKKLKDEIPFSSFDIAIEVIELHFQNRIGFVPLIESMHAKFHNGYLKIPMEHIHGDYRYFIDNYFQYLEDEDIDIMSERLAVKIADCTQSWTRGNYPGQAI